MGIQAFFSAFIRWARPALDIAILAYLLYAMYRLLIKTQAVQLAKGAALLVFVYAGAFFLKLETLSWVLNLLAPGLVIAMAIIFQPELRKIFIKLGQGGIFKRGQGPRSTQLDAILHAAELLAEKRRGALIAFVRYVALDDIVESVTELRWYREHYFRTTEDVASQAPPPADAAPSPPAAEAAGDSAD